MKKSIWLLLLILVMTAGVLTGCTQAETGLLGLYQEMTDMDRYAGSGEFNITINSLPADTGNTLEIAMIKNNVNKYAITYKGQIDMTGKQLEYYFSLKDKDSGIEQELTSLLLTNDTLYIKVSGIVSFLKMFNDPELSANLQQAFGDKEYLAIPLAELTEQMPNALTMGPRPFTSTGDILGESQAEQKLMLKIVNNFTAQVLKDYNTSSLISIDKNKYRFSVTPASGADWFISLATYVVNNTDKLGKFMTTSLTNFSDAEMTTLGLDPAMRQDYIAQIQMGIEQLNASKKEALAQIDTMNGPAKDEFIKMFAGSEYTATMEKIADQSYQSSAVVKVLYQDPQNDASKVDMTINGASKVAVCPAFELKAPTSGVITLKELEKRMTQTMTVQTGSGAYKLSQGEKLSQGSIGVKIIDGATYLQLRKVAETLDEQVSWDPNLRSAYVQRSGNRINMSGKIINGSTFVKIRDFENLGYQVQWTAATKTVTIIKNSMF